MLLFSLRMDYSEFCFCSIFNKGALKVRQNLLPPLTKPVASHLAVEESIVGLTGTMVQSTEEFHIVTTHQNKLLSADQNTKCCDSV